MTHVNAADIIQRLSEQIGAMTVDLIAKDLTIQSLQAEVAAARSEQPATTPTE